MTTVTNQLNTGSTPIAVSQGGIGANTLTTAYSPVCAGTTSTGAFQPASTGLSTSGYILCSNGSSAVPSFQQQPVTVTSVNLTTANIQNMYATPVQILAAQGAHTVIIVYNLIFEFIYNTTAFSAGDGGNVFFQYNSTAHGAGIVFAQPGISISSANSKVSCGPAANVGAGFYGVGGNIVNQGIYISNQTAAYTGGNSSARVTLYYIVLPTTV
jgi:hypothetical protein